MLCLAAGKRGKPLLVGHDQCTMSTNIAVPQFQFSLDSIRDARRHKRVIYVLSAFGDESYDDGKKRVFAVAAIFGEQHQWDALEAKWRARLPPGVDFHTTDCDSDLGDFKQFSHQENKALYRDLTQLLAHSQLLGYGVALDLISQDIYMKGLLDESAYYKAFGETIIYFAHRASFLVPREKVKFTFDRRLEIEFNATQLYDYMAKLPEWEDSWYLHEEVGFASRSSVGVQAADLYTRELMKRLDNEIGPIKRQVRKSFTALIDTNRFGGVIYQGKYFKGLQEAIKKLDEGSLSGAFKPGDYTRWRESKGIEDSWGARTRYLTQIDSINRAKGNPTHFDDVRRWGQQYEASDRNDRGSGSVQPLQVSAKGSTRSSKKRVTAKPIQKRKQKNKKASKPKG